MGRKPFRLGKKLRIKTPIISVRRLVTPYDAGFIFPYGDPLVIDMAERVVARLIVMGKREAEKSMLELSTASSIDKHECWSALGLIYLLTAGFGVSFSNVIRRRFTSTLARFVGGLNTQSRDGYLLTHYNIIYITNITKGLATYEAKYWGFRVPSVSAYLIKWLGRWACGWGQIAGKYDKPLSVRIGTTYEEAKDIFRKNMRDRDFEELVEAMPCP